jgi:hypothetical protein
MAIKSFLFFILLLGFNSIVLAQSNYKPGFVITLKGDTIKGSIDYREWNNNPETISFKKDIASNTQKFTVSDIRYFNIENLEAYQKYSGPISMDVVNTNRLPTGRDTSHKFAAVFLKILQKGTNVALYSYSDDLKARYFIGDSPAFEPEELVFRFYQTNDAAGNLKTVTENLFVTQLFSYANKYNSLDGYIERALQDGNYEKPVLLKVVSRINHVSKEEYNDQTESYFYAGIGFSGTTTTPQSSYQAAGGKAYSSLLPAISAGLNVFPNANTRKLAFRFELAIAGAQYKSVYDNKVAPYTNITYGYSSIALGLSPQMLYNFYNSDKLKLYAGGGVAFTKYFYFNKQYNNTKDGTPVYTSANPFEFVTFGIPAIIKAGIELNNKIDIYGSYLIGGPSVGNYVFLIKSNSTQFGITYNFK